MRRGLTFLITIAILLITPFITSATLIHAAEDSVLISNIELYHQFAIVNVKTIDQNNFNQSFKIVAELENGQCIGSKEVIFDKGEVIVEVDFDKIIEADKKVAFSIFTKSGNRITTQEVAKSTCHYDGFILSDYNTLNRFEIGPSGIVAYFHDFDTVNYAFNYGKNGYLNIEIGSDNYKALVGEDGWCQLKFDKTYMDGLEAKCTLYCAGNCEISKNTYMIKKDISDWGSYNVVTPDIDDSLGSVEVTTHHAKVPYSDIYMNYMKNGVRICFEDNNNPLITYNSNSNIEQKFVSFGEQGFAEGTDVKFWIENTITGKMGTIHTKKAKNYCIISYRQYPKPGDTSIYVYENYADGFTHEVAYGLDAKLHIKVNNKQYDYLYDLNQEFEVEELKNGDIVQIWRDDKFGNKSNVLEYTLFCDCNNCKWNVVKDANCIEDGKKVRVCTVCKEVKETISVPATGHTFRKEGYVKKKATYTTQGCLAYKCTNFGCTYEKTEIIPKLEKRSLKKKNIYLDTYDEVDLKKYINGTKKEMKWSVSKKKLIKNEGNGKYTGVFVGKTKVSVKFLDTNQTLTWVVYINKDTNYDLYVGDSKKIKTFTKYSGIKNSKWKSTNNVIKIAGGKLLFKRKGKGKIKCKHDGKTFEITFVVKQKKTNNNKRKSFLSYPEICKIVNNYVKDNWSSDDVLYMDNMVLTVEGVRRYYFHFTHYGTTQHYYLDDNKRDTEICYDYRY